MNIESCNLLTERVHVELPCNTKNCLNTLDITSHILKTDVISTKRVFRVCKEGVLKVLKTMY